MQTYRQKYFWMFYVLFYWQTNICVYDNFRCTVALLLVLTYTYLLMSAIALCACVGACARMFVCILV